MNGTLQGILFVFSIIGGIVSLILGIMLHKKIALIVAASFLMLVGLIVSVGYLADAPKIYTYPSGKIGMALPTGICFLVTGFCLLMLIFEVTFKKSRNGGKDGE